jgi:selenocysteine lyase/cysteine desulfurase
MPPANASWPAIREEFSLAPGKIHLAGMLLASNPRVVREAIERHRRALDDDPVTYLEHDFMTRELTNATMAAAGRYVGAPPAEIALTDSTTSGIAVVYGGLSLKSGDEIITTKHDHWVSHETLRLVSERSGASLKYVAQYDAPSQARAETMTKAIESAITPATRVVAVTWVHSSSGVKIPVGAIAGVVAKANASRSPADKILLCVDGVHGFGVENVTMADLGCDLFMAGCHKWIFGPRGTAIVWGKEAAWEKLKPTACPFDFGYVIAREYGKPVPKASASTAAPGGFRAFEHRWALREAFDFHLAIGKNKVESRIHELATQAKKGLAAMKNVTLHTPMDPAISSGIICFEVAGLKPEEVVTKLAAKGVVASNSPYIPSYARLTPGITNTPEEIERALAAVRSIS